jgi:hypothetical protein
MKIKELVGLRGTDYFDQPGTIIAAAHIKNWQSLKPYDNTGWMCPMEFKEVGIDEENAILVAFQLDTHEGDKQPEVPDVYVFGGEGVTLAYNYPNLPVKEVKYKDTIKYVGDTDAYRVSLYAEADSNDDDPIWIDYERYKSLEPYFEPEPLVWPTNQEKTKKFNTKQEAIEFTNNYINNLTREQAHKLLHPKYDIEELNKYIWDLGIGGFYYNKENTLFCNEILRSTILRYALLYIANK